MPASMFEGPGGLTFDTIQEDGKPSVVIETGPVAARVFLGMRFAIAAMARHGNDLIVEPEFDIDIAGRARGGDYLKVRDRARCPHELGDSALAPDIVEHVQAVDEEHRAAACGKVGQKIHRRSWDAESV